MSILATPFTKTAMRLPRFSVPTRLQIPQILGNVARSVLKRAAKPIVSGIGIARAGRAAISGECIGCSRRQLLVHSFNATVVIAAEIGARNNRSFGNFLKLRRLAEGALAGAALADSAESPRKVL